MAALTIQQATRAGITPTYAAAAAGGDTFANDGRTFLHVKNGGASPITVTIESQLTAAEIRAGTAEADNAVVVTNAQERIIGPFAKDAWNSDLGLVEISYTAVTTVTIAAISVND